MLSGLELANLIVSTLILALLAYTAYDAFTIRGKSSVGPYRNQALGIGLMALALAVYSTEHFVYSYYPPNTPTPISLGLPVGPLGLSTFILTLLLLFGLVDLSALSGRKLDPLHKDRLHWSRVRFVLWPLFIVSGATVAGEDLVFQVWKGYSPGTPPWWVPAVFVAFLGTSIVNAIVLLLTIRRTKELVLRRQLAWFGLFAFLFWTGQIFYALFLISGYCLLRSAKSLSPAHTLPAGVDRPA